MKIEKKERGRETGTADRWTEVEREREREREREPGVLPCDCEKTTVLLGLTASSFSLLFSFVFTFLDLGLAHFLVAHYLLLRLLYCMARSYLIKIKQ